MKFGIYLYSQSNFNPNKSFDVLSERVKYYDEILMDSLWVSDGLGAMADRRSYPHYETWNLISALSQLTKEISFGTMVSPFTLRSLPLFAKMVSTVDQMTKGRVIAGLGAGNPSQTNDKWGVKGMTLGKRMDHFEEYLSCLRQLFNGETVSSELLGIEDYEINPLPYNDDGPPILIAGNGEKKTLRFVAKYGDMSNLWGDNSVLEEKLGVLQKWCDKEGRDYGEIENTTMRAMITGNSEQEVKEDVNWYFARMKELGRSVPSREDFAKDRFVGSVEEVAHQIAEVRDLGINHLVLTINTTHSRYAVHAVKQQLAQL